MHFFAELSRGKSYVLQGFWFYCESMCSFICTGNKQKNPPVSPPPSYFPYQEVLRYINVATAMHFSICMYNTTQYTQFPCHSSATKHTACMRANGYHNKDKLGHKNRFHLGDRIFFFASGVFIGGSVSPLLKFYCIFHYSIHVQSLNGQPSKC